MTKILAIGSRWNSIHSGVARLKSANITFSRQAYVDITPRIQFSYKEGLRLQITLQTTFEESP